jgi:hypothetical protein
VGEEVEKLKSLRAKLAEIEVSEDMVRRSALDGVPNLLCSNLALSGKLGNRFQSGKLTSEHWMMLY